MKMTLYFLERTIDIVTIGIGIIFGFIFLIGYGSLVRISNKINNTTKDNTTENSDSDIDIDTEYKKYTKLTY